MASSTYHEGFGSAPLKLTVPLRAWAASTWPEISIHTHDGEHHHHHHHESRGDGKFRIRSWRGDNGAELMHGESRRAGLSTHIRAGEPEGEVLVSGVKGSTYIDFVNIGAVGEYVVQLKLAEGSRGSGPDRNSGRLQWRPQMTPQDKHHWVLCDAAAPKVPLADVSWHNAEKNSDQEIKFDATMGTLNEQAKMDAFMAVLWLYRFSDSSD